MARFTKTVIIDSPMAFNEGLQPGQWFRWAGAGGARGQWYGKTRAQVDAVRYQADRAWGTKSDTERARIIRLWAKQNGAL
jgi:hypothetical protein